MSDTPLTDALMLQYNTFTYHLTDLSDVVALARKLERDRAALLEALKAAANAIQDEVRAGNDGADTHPMILKHAKVLAAARAAIKQAEDK